MGKQIIKRFIYLLSGVVVLFCIATVLGGLYLVDYALKPGNRGKDIATSYTYIYNTYPYLEQWVDSLTQINALKDTFIQSPDGVALHAFYVKAAQPTRKTAVIIHGYTDNAIRMFMIGHMFSHSLGYNILLPDLRYSGLSGGETIQMGWKDRKDVLQWIDVAQHIYGDTIQIAIHGISMGGATTMMLSGEALPPCVKAFVEDCGYTSVWEQFKKELKEQFHLPAFPLLYAADLICQYKYDWGFKEASALEQVKKCQLPICFIHGGQDTFVPTYMGKQLYEAKPQPKQLWIEPEATHATSFLNSPEEYTALVRDFLQKYIP